MNYEIFALILLLTMSAAWAASSSSLAIVFGSVLRRFSHGVSRKPLYTFPLQCNGFFRKRMSSSSWYSSNRSFASDSVPRFFISTRNIWTFGPLYMGRRACKIADRKTSQNKKKMKLYTKIGKQVVSAVKKGGPNPASNTALAALFEKIKDLDVPKDIIDRNIKKASEKGQEAYMEKVYEVYGYGGAGIVVEALTDNINRTVAAIRGVLKEYGGKMADSGSIMFKFRRARVVNVNVTDTDKDELLAIALDAGAEDVMEPSVDDNDFEEEMSEKYYKVVCSSENYLEILSKLRDAGINFEPDNGFELLPITTVEVDDEAMELNKELLAKLLDLDDVDAVYTDQML